MESRRAKPKSKQAFNRRAVRNPFIKFVTNEPKVTTCDNLQSASLPSARTRHVCVRASKAINLQFKSRSGNFVEEGLNKKIHPPGNLCWGRLSCSCAAIVAPHNCHLMPARSWPTGKKSSIISEGIELSCNLNLLSKRPKLPRMLKERLHAGSGSSLSQRRQKEAGGQDAERHVASHHAWLEWHPQRRPAQRTGGPCTKA